jgi:two-component system, cell cycle sensor histidine kinase and response regulator CckA
VQAHAFEPFYTTKKEKGTGLGLATVYGIIKQNGGDVFLYSDQGKGTTVKVYFPRVAEATESDRRKEPREVPRGTETILVVEDEDMVRRVVMKALVKHGYKVLEAKNGKDALQICASYADRIHLLLTDVIMPGMNGRQLAELLAPSRPEMNVLYMSGYTENVIVNRGILKPGISFIEKTFTSERLCFKVREVLEDQPSNVSPS